MRAVYIARRFAVFLLIVWLAASLNFFLPRLSGQDPVRTKLLAEAQLGGYVQAGIEDMVKEYNQKFGLDKPLWRQYVSYLGDTMRLDFNYSISNYPRTVRDLIAEALPWTICLLGLTTLFSFAIGTFLGALLAWPGAPRWMRYVMPPLWALHAIPFFLLGLILMYLFAFQLRLLPIFGGYSPGAVPAFNVSFILDVLAHATLPALSIILVATGGWALGMRGMMVTTMGEDYVGFAEAKGLKASTIFLRYCVRNAILPQTTALALALGQILSGAVLVEVIFGYPGIGALLFQAIRENDHFLIQGIVFTVIVALGFTTFILDVLYPWLDPRISYQRSSPVLRYLKRNPSLAVGLGLLSVIVVFVLVGMLLIDPEDARPLSVPALRPPSWEYPFGTDRQGRDLFAAMVVGTPLTLRIGFIAGILGVTIGTVLAFIAGYYRGAVDTVISGIADIGLTVPGLLILIIIAVSVRGGLTVNQMALIVASLAWLNPTRTIRAQVLTLRERGYVEVARLSGMNGPEIIFFEMIPNLLPYLGATLVNAVSAAILASIGLEVLGLGPLEQPTLGMTLYWVNFNAAILNGWWWWWTAPIAIILLVFLGLFFMTVGLDEIANPRLRRSA